MRIAQILYFLFRNLPIATFAPSSPLVSEQQSRRRILFGRKELESKLPRLRMRVLHRDRSRCRGCDRKGDEVTLCIHLIRPGVSGMDAMVTLCLKCTDLAIENRLESDAIPHFLRHLWCHLHHPEKTIVPRSNLSGPCRSEILRGPFTVALPSVPVPSHESSLATAAQFSASV
jgi:hypothetical protein